MSKVKLTSKLLLLKYWYNIYVSLHLTLDISTVQNMYLKISRCTCTLLLFNPNQELSQVYPIPCSHPTIPGGNLWVISKCYWWPLQNIQPQRDMYLLNVNAFRIQQKVVALKEASFSLFFIDPYPYQHHIRHFIAHLLYNLTDNQCILTIYSSYLIMCMRQFRNQSSHIDQHHKKNQQHEPHSKTCHSLAAVLSSSAWFWFRPLSYSGCAMCDK